MTERQLLPIATPLDPVSGMMARLTMDGLALKLIANAPLNSNGPAPAGEPLVRDLVRRAGGGRPLVFFEANLIYGQTS